MPPIHLECMVHDDPYGIIQGMDWSGLPLVDGSFGVGPPKKTWIFGFKSAPRPSKNKYETCWVLIVSNKPMDPVYGLVAYSFIWLIFNGKVNVTIHGSYGYCEMWSLSWTTIMISMQITMIFPTFEARCLGTLGTHLQKGTVSISAPCMTRPNKIKHPKKPPKTNMLHLNMWRRKRLFRTFCSFQFHLNVPGSYIVNG